jgi:hypothetical protein
VKNGSPFIRCGTNYLTSGAAASLGALAVLSIGDRKASWSRLPDVLIAATLALIVAQPIGPKLQEHITTCADLGDLEVVGVRRLGPRSHYVATHSAGCGCFITPRRQRIQRIENAWPISSRRH